MTRIRETCSCGASTDIDDRYGARALVQEWRDYHRHHTPPRPEQAPICSDCGEPADQPVPGQEPPYVVEARLR